MVMCIAGKKNPAGFAKHLLSVMHSISYQLYDKTKNNLENEAKPLFCAPTLNLHTERSL